MVEQFGCNNMWNWIIRPWFSIPQSLQKSTRQHQDHWSKIIWLRSSRFLEQSSQDQEAWGSAFYLLHNSPHFSYMKWTILRRSTERTSYSFLSPTFHSASFRWTIYNLLCRTWNIQVMPMVTESVQLSKHMHKFKHLTSQVINCTHLLYWIHSVCKL